jgi:predicted RNA-binding Zn ribbon-like protein
MARKGPAEGEWQFHITGGHLCLDFANTVSWRRGPTPIERLNSYADLLAWARQARLLGVAEERRLLAVARSHPRRAAKVLDEALELRALVDRLFSTLAQGKPPKAADLADLNARLATALTRSRIARHGGSFAWRDAAGADALDRMLPEVVRSAAELLVSPELALLRRCGGWDCGWLFVDLSRTRRRRWCDMRVCGNRAKVRRHYERTRAAASAPATRRADPARGSGSASSPSHAARRRGE